MGIQPVFCPWNSNQTIPVTTRLFFCQGNKKAARPRFVFSKHNVEI